MYCAACGNTVASGENFCRVCGRGVAPGTAEPNAAVPPSAGAVAAAPAETSGKAIASLVCGLFLFAFPISIVAIVLGHISLSEIRKSAGRLKGEGIALAGLVLGYMGVAGIPVILIIAAIAIPNLLRARMAANESSAVASVRTLNTAEISYSAEHSSVGYTCSLSDLSGLIDSRLASGQRSGYEFQLTGCTADEHGTIVKYRVVGIPTSANQSGTRAFCSDESAVIRVDAAGSGQNCLEGGSPLQ